MQCRFGRLSFSVFAAAFWGVLAHIPHHEEMHQGTNQQHQITSVPRIARNIAENPPAHEEKKYQWRQAASSHHQHMLPPMTTTLAFLVRTAHFVTILFICLVPGFLVVFPLFHDVASFYTVLAFRSCSIFSPFPVRTATTPGTAAITAADSPAATRPEQG